MRHPSYETSELEGEDEFIGVDLSTSITPSREAVTGEVGRRAVVRTTSTAATARIAPAISPQGLGARFSQLRLYDDAPRIWRDTHMNVETASRRSRKSSYRASSFARRHNEHVCAWVEHGGGRH